MRLGECVVARGQTQVCRLRSSMEADKVGEAGWPASLKGLPIFIFLALGLEA